MRQPRQQDRQQTSALAVGCNRHRATAGCSWLVRVRLAVGYLQWNLGLDVYVGYRADAAAG